MRSGKKKSLVGDPINFRGMANAPVNEAGVVALFSMVARDLGYYVQEIGSDFPDAILRRKSAGGGKNWPSNSSGTVAVSRITTMIPPNAT